MTKIDNTENEENKKSGELHWPAFATFVVRIKSLKWELVVFLLFVVTRLPQLGHEMFNTDVWKWKARIFNFSSGLFSLNFDETIQSYHPGVTLMWLGTIGVKIQSFINKVIFPERTLTPLEQIFQLHFWQKLVIVLFIALILTLTFFALRQMLGVKFALLYVVFLNFEPFYIALTRVIHLEGILSTLMLGSFVWLMYYFHQIRLLPNESVAKSEDSANVTTRKISIPSAILLFSGILSGLAIITKTSGLFMLPLSFMLIFLILAFTQKTISKMIITKMTATKFMKTYFIWLLGVALGVVLVWPALWTNPVFVLEKLQSGVVETGIEDGHDQLYFGNKVMDPGPTFYPVVFLFRMSPLFFISAFVALFFARKIKVPREFKIFLGSALLFFLSYLVFMTIPSKKLDRYLLPAMVLIPFFYTYFVLWLTENISAIKKNAKVLFASLLVLLCVQAIYYLPDYFSYYNPLFGGLSKGIYVLEPKWIIGHHEVVETLGNLQRENNYEPITYDESIEDLINTPNIWNKFVVAFPEKYYTQIYPFVAEINGRAVIVDLTNYAVQSRYHVFPVWEDVSNEENRVELVYETSVYLRGTELYRIYKVVDEPISSD